MTIVDRYVARTFLASYVILLAVCMGFYALGDMLLNLDEFTKSRDLPPNAIILNILDYYGCNLSLYFSQLAGPVMTIAAAFTLAMMLRNNELTALISSGMPLQRLTVPLLACSLVLIGLWVVNQEVLLPELAHRVVRRRDDLTYNKTVGVYCARDRRNNIVSAQRLYPQESRMYSVCIIEPDERGAPAYLIHADRADYDAPRGVWLLTRGTRLRAEEDAAAGELSGGIRYEEVVEFPLELTPEQLVVRQKSEWAGLMSVRQMNELIRSGRVANQGTIVMSRHVRLTQPLVQLVLLALVVPFFLMRAPVSVLAAGGRALVTGGLFFGATFVIHSMVRDQAAALLAWLPILSFGPLAVWRLGDVRT